MGIPFINIGIDHGTDRIQVPCPSLYYAPPCYYYAP